MKFLTAFIMTVFWCSACQAAVYQECGSGVVITGSNLRAEASRPFAEVSLKIIDVPGSRLMCMSFQLQRNQLWQYQPTAELNINGYTLESELMDTFYHSKEVAFQNIITGRPDSLKRCESSGDYQLSAEAARLIAKADKLTIRLHFADKPDMIYQLPANMLWEWQQVIRMA